MELKLMPWCPNCKAEYQNGITVCSDCKIELVESLEEKEEDFVAFFQAEDKKIADKLVRYFQYSDLKSKLDFDEENEIYVVSIPPKKEKQAKKLYQAFYFVERDNLNNAELDHSSPISDKESPENENSEDEANSTTVRTAEDHELSTKASDLSEQLVDDALYEQEDENSKSEADNEVEVTDDEFTGIEVQESSSNYIFKADQYKDLAGTVWIFLFFGVAGIIFLILNAVGILSFFSGLLPTTVMGAVFLFFLYIAVSTNQKAKKVQAEIDAENKLTGEINQWLQLHVTESFLSSIHNDDISEELNYLKKVDTMKELLLKEFGTQNLAYLDRLIEEYYSNTFENME
jgi:transcription initiation factor TFIIIB Brf1 subunit/transcription initiation factor TFIIB